MAKYKLKPGEIGSNLINSYKQMEKKFTNTFLKEDQSSQSGYSLKTGGVEEKVIDLYKKIEKGVVGGYQKIEDKFVDTFLEEVELDKGEEE